MERWHIGNINVLQYVDLVHLFSLIPVALTFSIICNLSDIHAIYPSILVFRQFFAHDNPAVRRISATFAVPCRELTECLRFPKKEAP